MKKGRTLSEPFRIKMVEPIHQTTYQDRVEKLEVAGFNPFLLRSSDVYIDFLTDSGTGAMSEGQWSAMMLGDESYAGARSWEHFKDVVSELTGMPYIFPTHQGRAAERILYSRLGGKGKIFISNTHFDTTRANIEYTGAEAIDLVDGQSNQFFLGNMDIERMLEVIQHAGSEKIGAIIMTVTNNSAGGQPVSMENMQKVRDICDQYGLTLVLDGCRIAENSYFIRHREPGFENISYKEIAKHMLGLADAFVMSAKKDALVNIGGILAMRNKELADQCQMELIISEGFTTYGGLSGRDLEAMAVGLKEVFQPDYLEYRIKSTGYLGHKLHEMGIPVVMPIGGHAVYIDASLFYPHIPANHFPGQALVCELYKEGGIRSVEVGSVMFGKYGQDGSFIPAARELVRLAIPRRVYTQSHIDFVIDVFEDVWANRHKASGYQIISEPPFLRHFTARFEKCDIQVPTI